MIKFISRLKDYSYKDALISANSHHLIAVFQEKVDNGKF